MHDTAPRPDLPLLVERVLAAVPGYAVMLDEAGYARDGLTVEALFSFLADYLSSHQGDPAHHDTVVACLDLIEEMLGSCDEDDGVEIGASFLGNLSIIDITSSLLSMGPRTLTLLESLEDGELVGS